MVDYCSLADVKSKTSKQLYHSKLAYHQATLCFATLRHAATTVSHVFCLAVLCVRGSVTAIFLMAVLQSRHYTHSLVGR